MRVQSTFCDRAIAVAPHSAGLKPNSPEFTSPCMPKEDVDVAPAKPAELASRTVNLSELSGAEYVSLLSSTGLASQLVRRVIVSPEGFSLCSSTKPFVLLPTAEDVCVAFHIDVSEVVSGWPEAVLELIPWGS